jgi:hypothetical protein
VKTVYEPTFRQNISTRSSGSEVMGVINQPSAGGALLLI